MKFLILIIFISLPVLATPAKNDLYFKVVFGEQVSEFVVKSSKDKPVVEFSNNFGRQDLRQIKPNDFKFLMRETKNYKGQNSKEFCKRHYIEFSSNKRKHIGCIASPTKISKQLKQTTSLLSLLF